MQNQFSIEIAHAKSDIASRKDALERSETVIIGADPGLSTSAGFVCTGERFHKFFSDFACKYHFTDMYSGGLSIALLKNAIRKIKRPRRLMLRHGCLC